MDRFTPQYFDQDETSVEDGEQASPKDFVLAEFDIPPTEQKRTFSFDNEIQRNYDPGNVNTARESVVDVFRDAMERLQAQARQTKAEARDEGFQEGHKEGFKEGERAAREEFTPFLETLQGLVEDLTHFRETMYTKVEREMIEMIVKLTRKVILAELSSREDSIQNVLRLAVQSVLDRERMVIKVNPQDKIHAESYRPELHHLFSEIKNITFEAQSSIERGGCIIESNFGTVDAQIHNLQEQIDRVLKMAPPGPVEPETPAESAENPPEVAENTSAPSDSATGETPESPEENDEVAP